jgi:hypothetical protein
MEVPDKLIQLHTHDLLAPPKASQIKLPLHRLPWASRRDEAPSLALTRELAPRRSLVTPGPRNANAVESLD